MYYKLTHYGNPHIGVFAKANDSVAFLAKEALGKFEKALKERLDVEVVRLTIAGGNIVGMYMALTDKIALLPGIVEKEEVDLISSYVEPLIIDTYENAWGNNVVIGRKGVVASPWLREKVVKELEDHLGLEVFQMPIAGYKSVGAVLFSTSKGALISYSASDEEIDRLSSLLGFKPLRGSINMGSQFVSLGIVANSHGYVVGETTTGIEVARVEEALDLVR